MKSQPPQDIYASATLANGVKMPYLGLGLYKTQKGIETSNAITYAIDAGYRHFDAATFYKNEKSVGEALKKVPIKREELFITSKIWCNEQGYKQTFKTFEKSLNDLQLDYIDLYLIHWPMPELYIETWQAMEELYAKGKIRAIGVSNCEKHHIEKIISEGTICPMVNQIEFHPHLVQNELLSYCHNLDIQVEAWSPLKRGYAFNETILSELAVKYNKSIVQIILRWHLQKGIVVIPKSSNKERINENANVFNFSLTEDEINQIDSLHKNERTGSHPDNFVDYFKSMGYL